MHTSMVISNSRQFFLTKASYMSRQDELNHMLWLATQVDKMALSCTLRTTHCFLQENSHFPESQILNYILLSLCGHDGLISILFFSCEFMHLHVHFILANNTRIQQSWPHAWSKIQAHIWKVHIDLCSLGWFDYGLKTGLRLMPWPASLVGKCRLPVQTWMLVNCREPQSN